MRTDITLVHNYLYTTLKYLRMENTITQELRNNYTLKFFSAVQELTERRKSLRINQNTMAVKCGVSLRTIQNFENYKSENAYLIYAYKQILKEQ